MGEEQKKQLEQQLWNIANELRGKMDADEFRDYILGFIFYKYLITPRLNNFSPQRYYLATVQPFLPIITTVYLVASKKERAMMGTRVTTLIELLTSLHHHTREFKKLIEMLRDNRLHHLKVQRRIIMNDDVAKPHHEFETQRKRALQQPSGF